MSTNFKLKWSKAYIHRTLQDSTSFFVLTLEKIVWSCFIWKATLHPLSTKIQHRRNMQTIVLTAYTTLLFVHVRKMRWLQLIFALCAMNFCGLFTTLCLVSSTVKALKRVFCRTRYPMILIKETDILNYHKMFLKWNIRLSHCLHDVLYTLFSTQSFIAEETTHKTLEIRFCTSFGRKYFYQNKNKCGTNVFFRGTVNNFWSMLISVLVFLKSGMFE